MGLFDLLSSGRITEADVQRIMEQRAKTPRWTVSDTPGHGNVPPWSVMSQGRMAPSSYGMYQQQAAADENPHLAVLPGDARREAEQRLLEMENAYYSQRGQWPRGMLPINSREQSPRGVPEPKGSLNRVDGMLHPNNRARRKHGGGGVRG
jgi:hypothetical protein